MDGAKKSKYDTFVVCGVLLVLLGAGTMRFQVPKSVSTKADAQTHPCEICGKDATTTLNIGTMVHFVCADHAVEGIKSPVDDLSSGPMDQSEDETTDQIVRTVDGIAVFGPNLTDADVESIRKVIAELPDSSSRNPIDETRQGAKDDSSSKSDAESPSDLHPKPSEKHVIYIRQTTENEAQVYTGELRGPHDGRGEFFRMRKTDAGWVVFKIANWES